MNLITWAEFKSIVDTFLDTNMLNDDTKIGKIDIYDPTSLDFESGYLGMWVTDAGNELIIEAYGGR